MKKKIGIIGGAGPMASCKLYEKIVKICQQSYNCKDDKDFPEIHVTSYPFSNMITVEDRQVNKNKLFKELQNCFNHFLNNGINVTAIACNTLHTIIPEGIKTTPNFIHIADATLQYAQKQNCKKLLILGSQTTLGFKLYSSPLVECIVPRTDEQVIINKVIEDILFGHINLSNAELLRNIIKSHIVLNNIDGIVLGCTEIPLLHEVHQLTQNLERSVLVFDTIEVLALELTRTYFN